MSTADRVSAPDEQADDSARRERIRTRWIVSVTAVLTVLVMGAVIALGLDRDQDDPRRSPPDRVLRPVTPCPTLLSSDVRYGRPTERVMRKLCACYPSRVRPVRRGCPPERVLRLCYQ